MAVRILALCLVACLSLAISPERRTPSEARVQERVEEEWILRPVVLVEKYLNDSRHRVAVPVAVRKESVLAMRKILKEEWIPKDLDRHLVGLKDVVTFESKDQAGKVFSQSIEDLVVARYQIAGFRFHTIEDGRGVGVRVDLPPGTKIRDKRESVKSYICRFLKVDAPRLADHVWQITSRPGLFHGSVQMEGLRPDRPPPYPLHWWDSLFFGSDGTFFFVSTASVNDVTSPTSCGSCRPDRF